MVNYRNRTASDETGSEVEIENAASDETMQDTDGLVKMHKNGESLHVHPTTVAAHKDAGWNLA